MVQAILAITVNQGIDPARATLIGGGGAAGLNSIYVARRLHCPRLIIPDTGAALSAAGALMSRLTAEHRAVHFTTTADFDPQGTRERIDELAARCQTFLADAGAEGEGAEITFGVEARYEHQAWEIPVALGNTYKIVVDCGNGVAGVVAPQLLRALGHDVVELYCEVDGSFPNHHPDPSQPENLADLIELVNRENADFGLAFDGDGERLGVVDSAGNIIWPDRQMILFVKDVLSRNVGAEIIFDVKCSRHLAQAIGQGGGKPVMWRTGHSLIKSKMKEINSPLAGEMSGHIFFKERWYGFDDALYAAARLVEILLNDGRPPVEVFTELPISASTPELRINMEEDKHATFMEQLIDGASFEGGEFNTIDGMRVDFPDSWGLIRPSNTTPCLVLRFEGDDEVALKCVQEKFRTVLLEQDPGLDLPF